MGASLGAERTAIVPNTVQHETRKLQKNKAGHASSNCLSHLLSRGSGVRIPPGAPFLIFGMVEDQVEGLSICGVNTCSIDRAVRKHHFEQFRFFVGIPDDRDQDSGVIVISLSRSPER